MSNFKRTKCPSRSFKSPYYEGNTSYGGTSAKRARLTQFVSPFKSTSLCVSRDKETIENSKKRLNSNECLSDAAKRILATIESMASPLEDAKKIPCYTDMVSSKYLLPARKSAAPYLRSTKSLTPIPSDLPSLRPTNKNLFSSILSKGKLIYIESKILFQTDNLPFATTDAESSSDLTYPSCNSNSSPGGKILGRISNCTNTNRPVVLPNVPMSIQTLPTFNFGVKASSGINPIINIPNPVVVKQKPTTTIEVVNTENEFIFAEPIPKRNQFHQKPRFTVITVNSKKEDKVFVHTGTQTNTPDEFVEPKADVESPKVLVDAGTQTILPEELVNDKTETDLPKELINAGSQTSPLVEATRPKTTIELSKPSLNVGTEVDLFFDEPMKSKTSMESSGSDSGNAEVSLRFNEPVRSKLETSPKISVFAGSKLSLPFGDPERPKGDMELSKITMFSGAKATTPFEELTKPSAALETSKLFSYPTSKSSLSFNDLVKPKTSVDSSKASDPNNTEANLPLDKTEKPKFASPAQPADLWPANGFKFTLKPESSSLSNTSTFTFAAPTSGTSPEPMAASPSCHLFSEAKSPFTSAASKSVTSPTSSATTPGIFSLAPSSSGLFPSTSTKAPSFTFGQTPSSTSISSPAFNSTGFPVFSNPSSAAPQPSSTSVFSFGNIPTPNQPQTNGGLSIPPKLTVPPTNCFNFAANVGQSTAAPFQFTANPSMPPRCIKKAKRRMAH